VGGLPVTLFDVVVVAIVGLSGLSALVRGVVSEVLGLASWVGAGAVAFLALPHAAPLVRPAVANPMLADALAVGGVFLVALLALKLVSGVISRSVAGSAVGPLDKLLGLAFGAARGALVVCAAYLVASYLIKPELQPDWVSQAYLIEPVRTGAVALERLLPEPYREGGLADAGAVGRTPGGATAAGQGYSEAQRQALEQLLAPER
jgi:membrane protein required for colicin V production